MIAAVNVGCLLLARVLDRRRELAIRAALGADRRRIALQLFTEALVLVSAGGALGALAGPWMLDAFLAMSPLGRLTLPRYLELAPDGITLGLAAGTLAIAGLLAGTVPALLGRRVTAGDVLREGGRGAIGPGAERRWGAILIAGETALTLVLLVAGGLLVRSYASLSTIDTGFDRDRIARLAVTLSRSDISDRSRLPAMYERLRRELASVPGVSAVGLVHPTLPPWDGYRERIALDGVDLPHAPDGLTAGIHLADEGLLPMLGARILAGRNLEAEDGRRDAPVAVISRSLALFFGSPDRAVGRTIRFLDDDPMMPSGAFRVVGVAQDVAYDGLVEEDTRRFVRQREGQDVRGARHDAYVPLARFPISVVSIGASTHGDPAALIGPLRRRLADIAPASAAHWVSTMREEIALEYEPTRFYTILVAAFSSSALALTSVGLFALLSHAAARRTGEMGLRLALGASRASVAALLLKGGILPLAAGVAAGTVTALFAARALGGLLYGTGGFDLVAFGGAVAALLAVALAAGFAPAKRVASIQPMSALRID
jgi:predicted permease